MKSASAAVSTVELSDSSLPVSVEQKSFGHLRFDSNFNVNSMANAHNFYPELCNKDDIPQSAIYACTILDVGTAGAS